MFRSDFEWLGSLQIGENRGLGGLAVPGVFGSYRDRVKSVRDVLVGTYYADTCAQADRTFRSIKQTGKATPPH